MPIRSYLRVRGRSLGVATWAFVALATIVLALALLVALVLPYGAWDAMSFGSWSRAMANHWPHLRFDFVGPLSYHRPLFYVLQGWLWAAFGFHVALGRVLSLLFSVALLGGVACLAASTVRAHRKFAAALAVVLVLLIQPFALYIAAGLSDIPVAAMLALTAACLVAPRLGRTRLPLVAVGAMLSVLAKPSALPALVGLAAAVLLGPRVDLRRRALAAGALAVGTGVALLYDLVQARYLHLGLYDFLTSGTTGGFYAHLADSSRRRVLLDVGWLGPELRVLMLFGVVYAIARLITSHKRAVLAAFVIGAVSAWLLPYLGNSNDVAVGILNSGSLTKEVALLALTGSLLFALAAPAEVIPDRLQLARALVWALPPFVVWAMRLVYDARLLAPAWPPLLLIVVWSVLPAFVGAQRRREYLALVPAAAVVLLGAYTIENVNGLGTAGWNALRANGFAALGNQSSLRSIGLGGDFAAELNDLTPQVGPRDRILSYDQRLRFYYLPQLDFEAPQSCDQLRGHRIFVLLESDEVRTIYGNHASPAFWKTCQGRSLTLVAERPGAYTVFVNGRLRPTVGGCAAPEQVSQLAVEFGSHYRTAAEATTAVKRVTGLGFVQAHVDQVGCANYRIVETGVTDATVGNSVITEARSAHLDARLVNR
jgi:hypothetical protein